MKNILPIGLLALLIAGSLSAPAQADYYMRHAEQHSDTAFKNARRAQNQEFKAERAEMRGDQWKAEKHMDNAARDNYKVRKDEFRAIRDEQRAF